MAATILKELSSIDRILIKMSACRHVTLIKGSVNDPGLNLSPDLLSKNGQKFQFCFIAKLVSLVSLKTLCKLTAMKDK